MNKTNIKNLINVNDEKFITSIDSFKYEFNKGLCFVFNGRESFYGYYECINKIVEYIKNEICLYDIFSIKGLKLEEVRVIIENHSIFIEIEGLKYFIGLIIENKNTIESFDKFSINKNSYKKGNKIIYELFFHHKTKDVEDYWCIGSFICSDYNNYLNTTHWQRVREIKISEANHQCQLCSNKDRLHVHHNNYDNLFMEDMSDLIVLCEDCYKKFHNID